MRTYKQFVVIIVFLPLIMLGNKVSEVKGSVFLASGLLNVLFVTEDTLKSERCGKYIFDSSQF